MGVLGAVGREGSEAMGLGGHIIGQWGQQGQGLQMSQHGGVGSSAAAQQWGHWDLWKGEWSLPPAERDVGVKPRGTGLALTTEARHEARSWLHPQG